MNIDFKPTIKQDIVFKLFENNSPVTEILFGGGLGSAKSYMLAAITTIKCLQFPGIRVALCRSEMTVLKKTTLISFLELFGNWGLVEGTHYRYNSTAGYIRFQNGSEIIFQELKQLPSDETYSRLGGLLLTFAVIDEASECPQKGKEIIQSRCGRWLNDKYNIKPMLLLTCNPSRNFLYQDFYLPSKEDRLAHHRAFVSATCLDNPYLSAAYIENLKRTLSFSEQQRLLLGSWEYENDPNNLLELDDVLAMYKHIPPAEGKRYLSADIALREDNCIIMIWQGLCLEKIIKLPKGENVAEAIKTAAEQYNVPLNQCAYDADGIGAMLRSYIGNARAINNNGKTIGGQQFKNLKTQLYFKLTDLIKEGKVKIADQSFKKEIEEELLAIKHLPRDTTEGKIEMNSKADIKRLIGRSCDFSDTMAYAMLFQLQKVHAKSFFIGR